MTIDYYQFVSTGAAVLAAIAAILASVRSILNGRRAQEITTQIQEIHLLINSRVDQLLVTTATVARLEGAEDVRKATLGESRHSDVMNAIRHESGNDK